MGAVFQTKPDKMSLPGKEGRGRRPSPSKHAGGYVKAYARACVLFLILPAFPATPQTTGGPHILTEDDLIAALLSIKTEERASASALLRAHKDVAGLRLWARLVSEADKSSVAGDAARSLFVLALARDAAEQMSNERLLAFATYKMASVRYASDATDAAVEQYLLSKKIFERIGARRDVIYVLGEMGELYAYRSDYEKAREYSEQCLALAESLKDSTEGAGVLPDQYGEAIAWSTLGKVSLREGDYRAALGHFQKSLALRKVLGERFGGSQYRAGLPDTLADIGRVYRMTGDHMRALNYYNQALSMAEAAADKSRLANVLNSLGILYLEQNDPAKASEFLERSLRLFTWANNMREVARLLLNLGVMNQRRGRYRAASEYFRESLKKAEEAGEAEVVIASQEGLGAVHYEQGEYRTALEWLDRAWSMARSLNDKVRLAELLWRKGQVFYSQGDYDRSRIAAREAAGIAAGLGSPVLAYLARTLEGRSYSAQNAVAPAEESFTRAIEAVESMRDNIAGGERERQLFFEDKVSPYHEMVRLLAGLNDVREALVYAERAKGRVLLDVLRGGSVDVDKSLSQDEQAQERRLYAEMVSINTQIRAERTRSQADEASLGELEARLQSARNAYETLQASLYAAHPESRAKRGLLPAFTIEDASGLLPDSQAAILEYVVTGEKTFLFSLGRDSTGRGNVGVKVYPIKINSSTLSRQVERFRNLLATNNPGFRQAGAELYDLLVKPAGDWLRGRREVCIVPDGTLWNLPFQALQAADGKYLLETYALYYAPSLQVLSEMKKRPAGLRSSPTGRNDHPASPLSPEWRSGRQLYAIGNPAFGGEVVTQAQKLRNAPFIPLPETEKEVEVIGNEVYGPSASLVRTGKAAREDTVKAEMGEYRVLHFATHAALDDRSPMYSYIALAQGEEAGEDGLLEAWELMGMDLKAEMAVLSACETARGHVAAGEGMIGMTWALLVAGVTTTVASQWQVPSESTTRLMVTFHKNVAGRGSVKRMSKAEAWRQAALEMIKDVRYRMRPYYWAGFVVVGEGGRR